MKNSYLAIFTFLVGIFLLYTILFIYTFFNFNNEFKYAFQSLENLNFHEKYSKKIHHIRDELVLNTLFKKPQVEDLLFTTITNPEEKEVVVLFQGDSWMEQLTSPVDNNFISAELVKKFANNKKINFINGGIASYSPSLMSLQLDVLENDFQILPNIVIAYIDQTDLGDENCRYKNIKVFEDGVLKSIQSEAYIMYRDLFNYSQIYGLSKIFLKDESKILKTFHLINFKFKYGISKSSIRFYRKYISNLESDKEKIKKCYASNVLSYLMKPNDSEIKYFEDSIREYIKKIEQKKHIKKLILVTAPHKANFDSKELYKLNVSDLVDGIIKNKKNISHVNFSTILLNNKNFDYKNIWHVDNMHFNSNTHGKLFIKKILDELSKYLIL